MMRTMQVKIEQEVEGRFIAEVPTIPGALVYGQTAHEAIQKVEALALRILADRLEAGEDTAELADVFTVST